MLVGFDDHDLDGAFAPHPKIFGCRGAGIAAADDDDPTTGPGFGERENGMGQQRSACGQFEEIATVDSHVSPYSTGVGVMAAVRGWAAK